MINWPTIFQERLNTAGFAIAPGDTTLRTAMDIGPNKVRQVSTMPIDAYTGSIDIHRDEYQPLIDFYRITLAGGINPFVFNHPITEVPTVFRMVAPPSISHVGGLYYRASMSWEALHEAVE